MYVVTTTVIYLLPFFFERGERGGGGFKWVAVRERERERVLPVAGENGREGVDLRGET
jgi:hypothetical protein